ncbi:MAG: N-acetylglucosamine-6-phosphate deacetylase [Caldilineaceae bacterium]|nr:N-acetylglucosamine-6-phosphate deacetylase [Caldilineaceae bacterium]
MSQRRLRAVHGGRVWHETGFVANQIIALDGGRIATVTSQQADSTAPGTLDARDGIVIPGLIDWQINGALGWSFQAQHRAHFDAIVNFHRQRGTTTLVPTLVTADEATLLESLRTLAAYLPQAPAATLPGIHLEGPFLAPEKSGAHDPAALRHPDLALTRRFLAAAQGTLAVFTLAPELPDAPAVIDYVSEQGVIVSAGHTAADFATMQRAMAAGLRAVTHAGNASDWPHRAPGPLGFMASEPGVVGTLLAAPELACGVIMDGFHFHPALLRPLVRLKGPDRVTLVSDASTVVGCAPGDYASGGLEVTIHAAGFATSGRGGGWLAGSIVTLLDAVQRAVTLAGVPLETAVHMATLGPARLLGLDGCKGAIAPGMDADLLVLNEDLTLRHVIVGGVMGDGPRIDPS